MENFLHRIRIPKQLQIQHLQTWFSVEIETNKMRVIIILTKFRQSYFLYQKNPIDCLCFFLFQFFQLVGIYFNDKYQCQRHIVEFESFTKILDDS